jgi:CheY-like chemotaxis protein
MLKNLKTLLFVDDGAAEVLTFKVACEEAAVSFGIQHVSDGPQAINYLRGKEGYSDRSTFPFPHLILLDLNMPEMTGFEVLEWIRQQPQMHCLPVVVFSSSRLETDVLHAYHCGANSFLVKPMDFGVLVELVTLLDKYWFRFNETLVMPGE